MPADLPPDYESSLVMEGTQAAIAYEIVYSALGEPLPPPTYESNGLAISPSSAAEDAFTRSLVLRTVIDDESADLPTASASFEEEVEYLPLSINADEEQALPTVAKSSSQSSTHQHPPWHSRGTISPKLKLSPLLELHQEIVAFCDLVSPTPEDYQIRTAAVSRVSDAIKSIWNKSQVNVFGSFATGLYLPTSDIDMVILDSGCNDIQLGLKVLSKVLAKAGIAKNVQVIGKARVPIIKFIENESNVAFDVSFDLENGPEAASFIKDALNSIPPLRPLCLVLKTFLQQRDLNEVYTGGIGSYALLVMLLTYLQTHTNKSIRAGRQYHESRLEQNLGVLLVDFFEFYGRALNFRDVGISCRNGGHFFRKKERGFSDFKKPFMLMVEDPQAPENDIAKSSYNFQKVRVAFLLAHRQLTNVSGDDDVLDAGMLARVVRVNEKLAARKAPLVLVQEKVQEIKKKKPKKGRQKSKGDSTSVQDEQDGAQERRAIKRSGKGDFRREKYRRLNSRREVHAR